MKVQPAMNQQLGVCTSNNLLVNNYIKIKRTKQDKHSEYNEINKSQALLIISDYDYSAYGKSKLV
jgi:hypothetical protein